MADYIIRVDSSTKPNKNSSFRTKSGESSAAWTINVGHYNIAAGLIYFHYNGPNKTVYEGILAALSQLESEHFYPGGTDQITILSDCKIVIDQLDGRPAVKMKKQWKRVNEFRKRHPNVSFKFLYTPEKELEYRKVDILSKQGRNWLKKMIK